MVQIFRSRLISTSASKPIKSKAEFYFVSYYNKLIFYQVLYTHTHFFIDTGFKSNSKRFKESKNL